MFLPQDILHVQMVYRPVVCGHSVGDCLLADASIHVGLGGRREGWTCDFLRVGLLCTVCVCVCVCVYLTYKVMSYNCLDSESLPSLIQHGNCGQTRYNG